MRGVYCVLWPCTVACTVACTVQNTMFVLPCIFISRTLQFCSWRRGGTFYNSSPCKPHSFWSPIVAHMRSKCCNVASLFLSSCKDENVFGVGLWQMHTGICSSLCLHIHKPKNIPLASLFVGSSCEDESVFGLCFCRMHKGICSSLRLHIRKPKLFPGLFKKKPSSYMLSNHTWSPRAPLINAVAQSMPASEPKLLLFWRRFQAKRCNNIELGEGGSASFFAMSVTGSLDFWKNPVSLLKTLVKVDLWTNLATYGAPPCTINK